MSRKKQQPIAYLHTLHIEGGQTYRKLSFDGNDCAAFGERGEDYSPEYHVTVEPLFGQKTDA